MHYPTAGPGIFDMSSFDTVRQKLNTLSIFEPTIWIPMIAKTFHHLDFAGGAVDSAATSPGSEIDDPQSNHVEVAR